MESDNTGWIRSAKTNSNYRSLVRVRGKRRVANPRKRRKPLNDDGDARLLKRCWTQLDSAAAGDREWRSRDDSLKGAQLFVYMCVVVAPTQTRLGKKRLKPSLTRLLPVLFWRLRSRPFGSSQHLVQRLQKQCGSVVAAEPIRRCQKLSTKLDRAIMVDRAPFHTLSLSSTLPPSPSSSPTSKRSDLVTNFGLCFQPCSADPEQISSLILSPTSPRGPRKRIRAASFRVRCIHPCSSGILGQAAAFSPPTLSLPHQPPCVHRLPCFYLTPSSSS